jgi:hypothetical protein
MAKSKKKLTAKPTKKVVGAPVAAAALASGSDTGSSSRYERFQQILDHAAGKSTATYGSLGTCFWKTLKIQKLLDARFEEIRLTRPKGRRRIRAANRSWLPNRKCHARIAPD